MIREKAGLLLGKVPSCAWVQDRLPEYWGYGLPKREFMAVSRHLEQCTACTAAYEPIEKVSDMLARVAQAKMGFAPLEVGAARLMARIDEMESEEAARKARRGAAWPSRRAILAAATCQPACLSLPCPC